MNVLVEIILFYLLYRFIVGFLVPLFTTASRMRRQFHNMNSNPPAGGKPENPPNTGNGPDGTTGKAGASRPDSSKVGEYIDFEEVK